MTTRATLKSTIADDLARPDLSSQIARAIDQAITFYQEERLFWMDSRSATFSTVPGQSAYTTAASPTIAGWLKIDDLFLEDSAGIRYGPLCRLRPPAMERLLDQSAAAGRPDSWSWYDEVFFLHPVPDAAYTIRPMGQRIVAGPSTDEEEDNPWMTRGFELIRCAAKADVFLHTENNPEMAALAGMAAERELLRLRRDTSKRTATGCIVPTVF